MSSHRKICDVGIQVMSRGKRARVLVKDENNEWYELPIEVLTDKLKDLIFLPAERKDKRFRPKVEKFGY